MSSYRKKFGKGIWTYDYTIGYVYENHVLVHRSCKNDTWDDFQKGGIFNEGYGYGLKTHITSFKNNKLVYAPLNLEEIEEEIKKLYEFCRKNKNLDFYIALLPGFYEHKQFAELFFSFKTPDNIIFPKYYEKFKLNKK